VKASTLLRLRGAIAGNRPVVLVTRLADGAQVLWPEDALPEPLHAAARDAAISDKASTVEAEGDTWFLHPHCPPLRLLVVGAVHIAQALAPMAAAAGFAVTIIDPRRAFATADRFPGVALRDDWPDEAMADLSPDSRSAIVTLTHDPKLDDPALDAALRSDAFYIGALGSRRTHAKRIARLAEAGHAEAAIARIHAPVGLDIGAVTAPEIAVSILAELIAIRRGARP
jgi:xanthine dehydrogenase accessory factor